MCDEYARSLLRVGIAELLRQEGYTHTEAAATSAFTDVTLALYHQVAVQASRLAGRYDKRKEVLSFSAALL